MKPIKLANVIREVLQEDLFSSRSTVGQEFCAVMLTTQKVFSNSTEAAVRFNEAIKARQGRLSFRRTQ